MKILAFNGSPRKTGNTTALIGAVLEGARESGAETAEVRLHDINLKGCMGCLTCRKNPGFCAQKDDLSPFLEEMKTADGLVIGSPIYMYHVTGQMKMLVDRIYSFYITRDDGGYDSALPPGKPFVLITSQGHPEPERFDRTVRWLAGMTAGGLGCKEVGRIVQANSHLEPAGENGGLLDEARRLGRVLAGQNRA